MWLHSTLSLGNQRQLAIVPLLSSICALMEVHSTIQPKFDGSQGDTGDMNGSDRMRGSSVCIDVWEVMGSCCEVVSSICVVSGIVICIEEMKT